MASEADDKRWRRELAPWLEQLWESLWVSVPPLPTREQMRDVWLELDSISAPDLAPPTWTRTLEALELLDLLVRVDAHEGWELLLNSGILVDNRNFLMNESTLFPRDKVLPRYQLLLTEPIMAPNPPHAFLALRRMVGDDGTPWTPHSAEFLRIKQLLVPNLQAPAQDQHSSGHLVPSPSAATRPRELAFIGGRVAAVGELDENAEGRKHERQMHATPRAACSRRRRAVRRVRPGASSSKAVALHDITAAHWV